MLSVSFRCSGFYNPLSSFRHCQRTSKTAFPLHQSILAEQYAMILVCVAQIIPECDAIESSCHSEKMFIIYDLQMQLLKCTVVYCTCVQNYFHTSVQLRVHWSLMRVLYCCPASVKWFWQTKMLHNYTYLRLTYFASNFHRPMKDFSSKMLQFKSVGIVFRLF